MNQVETNSKENKNIAHEFYRDALRLLNESGFPYLVGGAFALRIYTDVHRDTKDLDLFCKAGEYQRILKHLHDAGYKTEITDARWLAKAFKDGHFIDIIFNTTNNLFPVDDSWFDCAREGELFGEPVRFIGAEELLWCKIYVQNRERFDGADVNHIILRYGKQLDWHRVWLRMEQHWHLLMAQLLTFQFIYPADRDVVPRWLFDELLTRAREQYELPASLAKVCLGPLVDHTQYLVDVAEWGYKSVTTKTI
jgi:hypothetical protein